MKKGQPSSSSSKGETDLDFLLKRLSVVRWIIRGCDNKEPLLLRQYGSLDDFNMEFDRVIDNLIYTEDQLIRVYIAGLKDEIAAPLRLLRLRSLQEVKLHAVIVQKIQEAFGYVSTTLTNGPNQTVNHQVKLGVQELQEPQSPPSAPSIVLASPALAPLEEGELRRGRKRGRGQQDLEELSEEKDLEELQNKVDNLIRENSTMKENLRDLSEECVELSRSNDSLEKELMDKYGAEAIADLLPFKPARITSDESHNRGSNRPQ